MALGVYAGATANGVVELPSPVSVKTSFELIWSENTGRAQKGANQAKMIGDVVAQKRSFEIKWGVITHAQLTTISTYLTKGFFYFALATTLAGAKSSAVPFYRSEIQGEHLPIGNSLYWKNVTVTVIEQ